MDAFAAGKGCAYTTLDASGLSVGLPAGLMGNSEVGHLNIGAGRVVYQVKGLTMTQFLLYSIQNTLHMICLWEPFLPGEGREGGGHSVIEVIH